MAKLCRTLLSACNITTSGDVLNTKLVKLWLTQRLHSKHPHIQLLNAQYRHAVMLCCKHFYCLFYCKDVFWKQMMNRLSPPVNNSAILCCLREFCHSPAVCWQSSCSRRCCCWRRSPWLSRQWSPAGFVFGSGSRRSRRGRASGRPCRSTPGPSSHSRWTGSSKGSRAGLWCWGAQNKIKRSPTMFSSDLTQGEKLICLIWGR